MTVLMVVGIKMIPGRVQMNNSMVCFSNDLWGTVGQWQHTHLSPLRSAVQTPDLKWESW